MRYRSTAISLVALSTTAAASLAQAPAAAPASSASPPIVANFSVRVRPEVWNWFEAAGDDGAYTYLGVLARAGLSQQLPRWSWRLEAAAPALLGLPDDAVAPAPRGQLGLGAAYYQANGSDDASAVGLFLKQAFVRVGRPPAQGGHALRLGRFEFVDGAEVMPANATAAAVKRDRVAHRLLGTFVFSHVGRSFDGAHYTFDRAGRNVTLLAVRPTRGVFDVEGWNGLDVTVGYAAVTLPVKTPRMTGDIRLFGAWYDDDRGLVATDNRPAAVRTADVRDLQVGTVGAHAVHVFITPAGDVDLLAWGGAQFGDWGSQAHRANALAAELGWQPKGLATLRPWLRGGWYRASGDDAPGDDAHGSWFAMLPTPRLYARFPYYTLMNVEDVFGSLIVRPRPTVSARLDVRRQRLAQAADLWYGGGGAFERESFGYAGRPSNGQRSLATLTDLSVDWRVTPRWTVSAYGAMAAGGDVVRRIYPTRDDARFAYLELQYAR